MLLAEDWSGFANERKNLRVTWPQGDQRSSYWLQLPYTYSIRLLVTSFTLDWLFSQYFYYVLIIAGDSSNYKTSDSGTNLSMIGYSPIAMITVLILGFTLLLVLIINGLRRYKPGIPLAGSCSAAISAACQRPEADVNAAVLLVMWGSFLGTRGRIGHCCFTSFDVLRPAEGRLYADRDAVRDDAFTRNTTF